MVRIPGFHCHGSGSIPGWGTEILQAAQHGQNKNKQNCFRTSLAVQWLRLCASSAGDMGLIPGQGTKTCGVAKRKKKKEGKEKNSHPTENRKTNPIIRVS